jgi:hypothetical protein
MLCPVLWCSRPGFVSIMRRATSPVTKGALDERKGVAWLEWDYAGPSDDGLPFEWTLQLALQLTRRGHGPKIGVSTGESGP